MGVAVYMAIFDGFLLQRFVDIRKAAKVPEPTFQQAGFDTSPGQLIARELPLVEQAQMQVEIWFHPSGSRRHRVYHIEPPTNPPPASEPEPVAEPDGEPEEPIGAYDCQLT